MQHDWELTLKAPRQELFAYLAEPRNRLAWQSSLASLTIDPQTSTGVGTRWHEVARGLGSFRMSITEWVEGVTWAEHGESKSARIDLRLNFSDSSLPQTTRLGVALTLHFQGLLRWPGALAPWGLRPLINSDLRRAAALCRPSSSVTNPA